MEDFFHTRMLIRGSIFLGIVFGALVLAGIWFARTGGWQTPQKKDNILNAGIPPKFGGYRPPPKPIDESNLDGTWVVESVVRDPQAKPLDLMKGGSIIIKGQDVETKLPDGKPSPVKLTMRIDATKMPRELDINHEDDNAAIPAIYELNGEILRIYFGAAGKERPKAFAAEPAGGHSLVVFKREWVWNLPPEQGKL